MRKEKEKKENPHAQAKEDAPPPAPSEKESVGIVLVILLAASLLAHQPAWALDKKFSSALSHRIMGVILDDLGDTDGAIEEYKKALKSDSENSIIHLDLASGYIKKNELPKAIAELKLAACFDPAAIAPHALLAFIYTSQNQPALALKEAADTYRRILNLSEADAQAHFYLGSIYNELKDPALAEKELKRAIELKPDYHEALNFLGYLYVEENKNLAEAERMIRKALALDPQNGAYLDSLGWLYFKKDRFKEALAELQKAISFLEDPVIYDHLGDAYLKLNNIEKAKLNWQKSLKMDPKQEKVKEKLDAI